MSKSTRPASLLTRLPWLARVLPWVGFDPKTQTLHPGAKNFFVAMGLLAVSLLLALNGSAAFRRGQWTLMAILHTLALSLAFYVSLRLVPGMAARSPLRWMMIEINYKLTREGVIYLVATFIISLAAINTGNNLLFIVLASLVAGILIGGIASHIVLSGIDMELDLPDHVFAERPVRARFTLRNRKLTLPSISLTVSSEGIKKTRKKRFWKKKEEATEPNRILNDTVYFPYIPRRRHSTQTVELTFPRRGRYSQDTFYASSKFPFGFLLKSRKISAASEIIAYPPIAPTEEFYEILPLLSGEIESYSKGRGPDLYAIRNYESTDSVRHVDWKATARTQEMKVREFTREDERRVQIVFDPFLPEEFRKQNGWEEQFERAVIFCACLAWHFQEINSQLQFRCPTLETSMTSASEIIYDVLRELALIEPKIEKEPGEETDFLQPLGEEGAAFHVLLTSRPAGSLPTSLWASSYVVFFQSL